jgi:hypothetical protein
MKLRIYFTRVILTYQPEMLMNRDLRKAAVAAFRERKAVAGIYAVVCRPSGERWIGRALDLDTIRNRLWFTLRHGNSAHRSLEAAWDARGPDAFALDIVERLDDERLGYVRDRTLKDRPIGVPCSSQRQSRSRRQSSTSNSQLYDVVRIVLPWRPQPLCSKGAAPTIRVILTSFPSVGSAARLTFARRQYWFKG